MGENPAVETVDETVDMEEDEVAANGGIDDHEPQAGDVKGETPTTVASGASIASAAPVSIKRQRRKKGCMVLVPVSQGDCNINLNFLACAKMLKSVHVMCP